MTLYADTPARRTRQVLTDAAVAVWTVGWVLLALALREAVLLLARPGEELVDGGTGLADRLAAAGSAVDGTPLVGDALRTPLDQAGAAAEKIAAAGTAQVEAVGDLAWLVAVAVAAPPVLLVLGVHLVVRWRFVREASAAKRLVRGGADLELFALRALAHQPLHALAAVGPDPVAAWRRGDPDQVRRLAELELRAVGVKPSDGRRPVTPTR